MKTKTTIMALCALAVLPGFGVNTNLWTGAINDSDWTEA